MNYLNGKVVMRGDSVVAAIDDQGAVVAGEVHELYDRDSSIRIRGYALRIPAVKAVLASDAYKAVLTRQDAKEQSPAS